MRRLPKLALAASCALLCACSGAKPAPTASQNLAWRAHALWTKNRPVAAAELYRRALAEARLQVDLEQQADVAVNLAWIHAQAGQYSIADSVLKSIPPELTGSRPVRLKADPVRWTILLGQGRCAEGKLVHEEDAAPAAELAMVGCALETGKTGFAEEAIARAEKAGAVGQALLAKGDLATARGNHAEAAGHYRAAFDEARRSGLMVRIGQVLLRQGSALEKSGDAEGARLAFGRAAELFESLSLVYPWLRASAGLDRLGALGDAGRERMESLKRKNAGPDLDAALAAAAK